MKNDMGVSKIIIRNKNDLHFVMSGKCIEWDACLDLIIPISVPSSLRINFLFSGRIATIFFLTGVGVCGTTTAFVHQEENVLGYLS